MTAYGRASDHFPFGKLVVEIHSVNRKMLDISVYLPKDLLRFDIDVRKWIASEVERGQVTIRVTVLDAKEDREYAEHHLEQLKRLQSQWNQVSQELGFDPKDSVTLPFLLGQLQERTLADSKEQEQEFRAALQRVIHAALDELMQMKWAEGKALAADIQKRVRIIQEQLSAIERKKQEPYEHYRHKITERLQEIGQITPELEEKITRELIFLAERLDVTEELVRLCAHIDQFLKNLLSSDKAIGRALDFLIQEMFREINTLGSKSMDTQISICVVTIKSELEKIREQIQNIE